MGSFSLQHVLVSSYLQDFAVKKVIWHDSWKYWEIAAKYLFLIGVLVWCALFFQLFESINAVILQRIYSILVIMIYIGCVYELLDAYLDTIVVTDIWLILFQRHSPFAQQTIVIQRSAIETIEHQVHGFWSALLNLWSLRIQVEDQQHIYKRVTTPTKTMQQILKAKEKATRYHIQENKPAPPPPPVSTDKETYNIFVEALGEVMEEYLKKRG